MLDMPQNTIEVVKALNYLIPSGGYDDLFQKLGLDMKKADRLGQIKRKKQIQMYLMQKQNNITKRI